MEKKEETPKQEVNSTEKVDDKKEETEEENTTVENDNTETKDEISQVGLFKSYMQCFNGLSEEKIKHTNKWNQLMKERKFWDTQPVVKVSEANKDYKKGPLKSKEDHKITKEKTKLPKGFEWREFNLKDDTDIQDLYVLLYENYVEDDGGVFRFNYSKKFLQWALMPPGYDKDLYFGIVYRTKKKEFLVGFISGIILNVQIEDQIVPLTEVNFLCVHKKYRSYSMASVLIREVVRRSNTKNIFQGLFTSGTMLPTPFAQTRYWHRSLNPEKLIKVKINRD